MYQSANNFLHFVRLILLLFVIIFHPKISFAQQSVTVAGKVREANTESALSGVSVVVKGSNKGTITDADGNFSITVAKGSRLVFTYLNYSSQERAINSAGIINIALARNVNSLNDVVVIGYGERKKKDITGAVSSITAKDIEKNTAMSPEQALQGTAAGVLVQSAGGDPGSRPVIRIRGVNTFGFADPLFVVDGVPIYEGGASNLDGGTQDIRGNINIYTLVNPDDIESMTVLKDASAAAIYGVQASNGVILITTKKGKAGRPRVDVSAYYGIQNIAKKIPMLNTQQYFQMVTESYSNNPDRSSSGQILPIGESPNLGPQYSPDSFQYGGNNPTTDWVGAVLNKNAPLQDYSVRVSGGSENTNYYISTSYTKTESPLKGNDLSRYSIAANVDSKISKYFQAGMTLRLNQEDALTNTQTTLGDMLSSIPFQPLYDKNDPTGYQPVITGVFTPNPSYDPTLLNPGALYDFAFTPNFGRNTRYNILAFQLLNNTSYQLYGALGNAYIQVTPLAGLRIKATIGGQYYFNLRKTWGSLDAYRFSQTPQNPYASQDGNAKGNYNERQGRTTNLNKELTANYSHTFGKSHFVDILLSASEQFGRWSWTDISGNVNYADPQYRSIVSQPPYTTGRTGILQEDALIGYLGRVSYKYNDKYYLDATLRHDGSSRLAPGHKFDNFPSFGVAWRISSESFFPKTNFINDFKIRGGWGKLGNFQSASPYSYLSNVSTAPHTSFGSGSGDAYGQYALGVYLNNFANTTLTWEKVKTTSIGFDAVLFNNHVNFTAEYFNKITYGIIQAVSLPPNTGIQDPADLNVATVRNRGVEFQISYNAKLGQVDFNISGNISTIANKVIKLNEGNPFGGSGGNRIEEGYPLNYLYGYKVGGIFQTPGEITNWRKSHADLLIGQSLSDPTVGYQYQPGDMYFQDIHRNPLPGSKTGYSPGLDSLVNASDQTYLGKTIPGYTYGFSLGADWKGIDISFLFQGVGDVQGYNGLRAGLDNPSSTGNMSTDVLGRWTTTQASTKIPRAVFNDPANTLRFSNRFIEQASYFRLKNLTLGYSLPKRLIEKLGFIQNFRIYVSSLNLFTITKWTGFDPEVDNVGNINNGTYTSGVPNTRQFLLGIKATF